jgi:hypothetical protein
METTTPQAPHIAITEVKVKKPRKKRVPKEKPPTFEIKRGPFLVKFD